MLDPADLQTVLCAQRGDRDALEALWLRHRGWVASVVQAHRPRDEEVEDLVQDVAVRFVRGVGGLADPPAFGGWLRTIAVNVARSAGRRARLRPATHPVEELPDTRGAARNAAQQRLQATWAALDQLDADQREPLLLKTVHGFSQAQIAATLGLTVAAVESRLARARRRLREAIAAAEHAPTLELRPAERRAR